MLATGLLAETVIDPTGGWMAIAERYGVLAVVLALVLLFIYRFVLPLIVKQNETCFKLVELQVTDCKMHGDKQMADSRIYSEKLEARCAKMEARNEYVTEEFLKLSHRIGEGLQKQVDALNSLTANIRERK